MSSEDDQATKMTTHKGDCNIDQSRSATKVGVEYELPVIFDDEEEQAVTTTADSSNDASAGARTRNRRRRSVTIQPPENHVTHNIPRMEEDLVPDLFYSDQDIRQFKRDYHRSQQRKQARRRRVSLDEEVLRASVEHIRLQAAELGVDDDDDQPSPAVAVASPSMRRSLRGRAAPPSRRAVPPRRTAAQSICQISGRTLRKSNTVPPDFETNKSLARAA